MVATQIKDQIAVINNAHPNEPIICNNNDLRNLIKVTTGFTIREDTEFNYKSRWVRRFWALVDREAKKKGKEIRFNCQEFCTFVWYEKKLAMYDLSGWFLNPDGVKKFDRIMKEEGNEDADFRIQTAINECFLRLVNIDWDMTRNGKIFFTIRPDYPEYFNEEGRKPLC